MSELDELSQPLIDDATDNPRSSNQRPDSNQQRAVFRNELHRSDSLTTGYAYINSIRVIPHGDKFNVFASLGMMVGREQDETKTEYVPVYENIDVLVGRTLSKSMRLLAGEYTKETGKLFGRVQVRNLRYSIDSTDKGVFLNTRGILETFEMGYLDQ